MLLKHKLGDQTASLPPLMADIPANPHSLSLQNIEQQKQSRRGKAMDVENPDWTGSW